MFISYRALLPRVWLVVITSVLSHADVLDWLGDESDCYTEKTRWIDDPIQIPWGSPWRAQKTLPEGLILANSSIPGAGLGVFSTIFIPRYTWLAEYEGEVILKKRDISDYAWTIWRGDQRYFFIDAWDEETSNWLRYINCSRREQEENVLMLQCFDKPFYIASKDIYPGQELLVYYGDNYARDLGIDVESYSL